MSAYSGPPDAVDYSFSRANIAQLKAAGIKLVCRYLRGQGKALSKEEAQALRAAGIGILLNWETYAARAAEGYAAGLADGRAAVECAEALGAPHGLILYFSVDFDATDKQKGAVADYFRGVRAGLAGRYRAGVYGSFDIVNYLHGLGLVDAEWQTYAWSGNSLSDETDIYQYLNGRTLAGASVDFNKIRHPYELGAWWPAGSPYIKGVDDSMSAAEVNALSEKMERVQANLLDALAVQDRHVSSLHAQLKGEGDTRAEETNRLVRILINGDDTRKSLYDVITSVATAVNDAEGGVLVRVAALQAAVEALSTAGVDMDAIQSIVSAAANSGASQGARNALDGATIKVAG